MLLGLIAVTSGRVDLLGGPPDRERRRRLGYVPQGLGLYGDLTVRENLSFSARAYGTAVPALPSGLTEHADVLVRELPLGAQRQVAFLAALAHSPGVIVLDEPTSGVDALARAALWDTIRAQAERGAGVLVTTHYMQEAQQCDRLLLMSDGRLVAEGSEADIIGSTTAVAVRTADWARAFAALAAAGAPVMLAGRAIRVANADPAGLAEVLKAAGIEASLQPVPATISERMLMLSRQAKASSCRCGPGEASPLGSPDARRAVLDAARELFAELGFERTTMRAVAARAGVDPALIYHYFGDKDGLLFAALQPPVDEATVFAGLADAGDRTGEELVKRLIGLWEDRPEIREQMVAILRTGLSHDRASRLLRDILSSFILAALGDVLAGDRRELRVALIGSQIGGLMLARYILKVPGAAAASPEDLVQAVGPTVQRYLTGDIGPHPPLSAAPFPERRTSLSAAPSPDGRTQRPISSASTTCIISTDPEPRTSVPEPQRCHIVAVRTATM